MFKHYFKQISITETIHRFVLNTIICWLAIIFLLDKRHFHVKLWNSFIVILTFPNIILNIVLKYMKMVFVRVFMATERTIN